MQLQRLLRRLVSKLKNKQRSIDYRLRKLSAKYLKLKNKHAKRDWRQKRLNVIDLRLKRKARENASKL